MIHRYLNVKTIAIQHTAIQLHNGSLCLVFHHHVLKYNKKINNSSSNSFHQCNP